MFAGPVIRGVLFGTLLLACGERAGDPIVTLASEVGATTPAGASGAGGVGGVGALAGVAGMSSTTDTGGIPEAGSGGSNTPDMADSRGPIGLCGPCTSSDQCGDANDACIHYLDERFCGRDCDAQHACPDGYTCSSVDSARVPQCVPIDHCPTQPVPVPSLSDIRDYVLQRVNSERAQHNRAPLTAASCLDRLAQDSAVDFAHTDQPLGKYVKECDPVWPNCACGWNTEAELSMAHYNFDWMTAIDHYLAVTPYNQNDRFIQGLLDPNVSDVGIGCWVSGDQAWLALSFR